MCEICIILYLVALNTDSVKTVRDVVSTNEDLVNYLLANKFKQLSYDDKIFVKNISIPQPLIANLVQSKSASSSL